MSDDGLVRIAKFARPLRDELIMAAHREETRAARAQHARDLATRKPSTLSLAERDALRSARRNQQIQRWKGKRNARR